MIKIGERVKIVDQDITGVVVRYDSGTKLVILDDDRNDWAEEGEEGVLIFNECELEVTK
jgi:hypothetical protein